VTRQPAVAKRQTRTASRPAARATARSTTKSKDEAKAEARADIIDGAKRCFAEHGYGGTTNKMIAAAAGVAPGLIYYYFESKEQLFIAVFDHMYESRDTRLKDYDFAEHTLHENLATMFEDSINLAHEDPSFVEVFTISGREVSRNPALSEAWDAHWERVVHVYFRIVKAAVACGEIPKTHQAGLVDVLVAWFSGFLIWVSRQPDRRRVDQATAEFLRIVDAYVQTPAPG
jgi:AcrR family transcriptional regulator